MARQTKLTLGQMTRVVADEWRAAGKSVSVPPDSDTTDEHAFWDEVERRYDGQGNS